jgi:phosphohistidine phosphatase
MRVILLRHGPAASRDASRWPDDALRPLTSSGRERTARAMIGLAKLEGDIGALYTSPLVRAEETARILAEVLECARPPETMTALHPGGSRRRIMDALDKLDAGLTVVLVGHEPDLGKLAGTFLFGAPASVPVKKAGACVIQFVGPVRAGNGRLVGFYPPRVLRRVAGRKVKV